MRGTSEICACHHLLTSLATSRQLHGIEECIKMAQNGGVGLVVYFQKEGRALGEVTKYLVSSVPLGVPSELAS